MTATLLAQGIVRATRELTSRKSGEVFGTEVSIMTEIGTTLGETIKVVIFDRDGEQAPQALPGSKVCWVVEVEAGRYGLGGTYVREVVPQDLSAMSAARPAASEPVKA